jgi:hypothetical protein
MDARLVVCSAVPMLGALAGGWLDERHHLGFTTWRSACRAAGLRLSTLIDFTLQLLPGAICGLLAGGALLIALGIARRHTSDAASCFAGHAGCMLTLPAGLFLCASALPLPVMLLADTAIALLAAMLLIRFTGVSVSLRTRAPSHA